MRKQMTTLMAGAILGCLSFGLIGCTDETKTSEEIKVKGPGGTATEKHEVTIDKTGKNPPAAPSESKP